MRTNEIKNQIYDTKKWEEKDKWEDLKYTTKIYTYDFLQYETIRSFSESSYTSKASKVEARKDQSNLSKNIVEFNNKSKPKHKEGNVKKEILMKMHMLFTRINSSFFKSGIFLLKTTKGEGLKILTPKQMLQRLLIDLAQVKPGNTFENLLNEIRQIIYSLYQSNKITKKVHNNVMNSIKM